MPVLAKKHLIRMERKRLRFGMPNSVAFLKQSSRTAREGKPTERLLFTTSQSEASRKNAFTWQIREMRAESPEAKRWEKDAGVISVIDGNISVTGKPSDVYDGPITPDVDFPTERAETISTVERLRNQSIGDRLRRR